MDILVDQEGKIVRAHPFDKTVQMRGDTLGCWAPLSLQAGYCRVAETHNLIK